MNPENLLQFIQNLFSGGKKQTAKKPVLTRRELIESQARSMGMTYEQLISARKWSEIDRFFGTGVGLKEIDYEKFNLASELYEKTRSGDDSKLSLIDFIKKSGYGWSPGGALTSGSGKGGLPGFANILIDPDVSKEQLPGLFQAYAEFRKSPTSEDPVPKHRVSQERLSAFGKENAPIIEDVLKQMYTKGDYTSIDDILGRIKLGDKPGGVTLDIGSLMSPDYYQHGRGAYYIPPEHFMTSGRGSTIPLSGKDAVYQNIPDALAKNLALRQRGPMSPMKDIESSWGEKSKYYSAVPSSAASINLGSWLGTAKQPNITGEKADDIRKTLIHELVHSDPLFIERKKAAGFKPEEHWPAFDEMIDKSLGGVEGGRESSTAIKKAYMQSPAYQQTMNHPMSQFVQMLKGEGIDPFSLYGQHVGNPTNRLITPPEQYQNQQ